MVNAITRQKQNGMDYGFKILLVDDKPENLVALEDMLAAENRVFVAASNGNEALKQLLRHDDIGLVMLDVQMPDIDGFEVASLIKTNPKTKHVAIIFVTAINKDIQHVLKGFEEGAVDYLSKPLDVQVTRAKVNVFERLYRYQQELKRALKEKDEVNEQLERFMYVVAHDLKSPLAGVFSMIDYMKAFPEIAAAPHLEAYFRLCTDALAHLNGMIASILEYSRTAVYQQKTEAVDTGELVEQIIKLLYLPAHVRVKTVGTLPVVNTNRLKLQQVFQNFISNAIKHNDKAEAEIEIGAVGPEDGYYAFYVKDNGPGIAHDDHERIFRLFEATAPADPSTESNTGVGLNVVKLFVEERGGKLGVDSVPGAGSTFRFTWPAK